MPGRLGRVTAPSSRVVVWQGLFWSLAVAFWISAIYVAVDACTNRMALYGVPGLCAAFLIPIGLGLAKRAWLAGLFLGAAVSYLLMVGLLLATLTVY